MSKHVVWTFHEITFRSYFYVLQYIVITINISRLDSTCLSRFMLTHMCHTIAFTWSPTQVHILHVHGFDPHKCLHYTATDTHCLCFAFAFVAIIRFGSEQAGEDEETAPEAGATHSQGLKIEMSQRVSFQFPYLFFPSVVFAQANILWQRSRPWMQWRRKKGLDLGFEAVWVFHSSHILDQ